MVMSSSSISTTDASTATVADADAKLDIADNQTTCQVDAGPNPAAADLPWTCEKSPPVGPVDSQKTAVEALKQYAVRQGFAISVSRSRLIGTKRSFLTCSQGKYYRRSHSRLTSMRDRGTKKVGCLYELVVMYDKYAPKGSAWSTICVNNCHTGHSRCISTTMLSALPAARRATREIDDINSKVVQMHQDGAASRIIVNQFKDAGAFIKAKDVQNIVQKAKRKALGGKTPTEALLKHMKDQNIVSSVSVDEDNHVRHLFWQPELTKNLKYRHNEIFMMDCTYKTNAYSLPLLYVVGFASTNQTFTAAVGFMDGEAFVDYEWVICEIDRIIPEHPKILVVDCDLGLINAIALRWPNAFIIICRFHIANNIITRCRQNFTDAGEEIWTGFMSHWKAIVQAPTEETFMELWQQLPTIADFSTIAYLNKNKFPLRYQWASFSIDRYQHFGHTVTSRVGGAHYKNIKSWLNSASGTLLDVYRRISRCIDYNYKIISETMSKERVEILTNLPGEIFLKLHRKISRHALVLLKQQYLIYLDRKNLNKCIGYYARVHGIPCAHVICKHIEDKRPIKVSDFAKQWHLDNFDEDESPDADVSGILHPFRITKSTSRKRSHQKSTNSKLTSKSLIAGSNPSGGKNRKNGKLVKQLNNHAFHRIASWRCRKKYNLTNSTRNLQSVIRRGSRSLSVIVAVKNAVTATDLVTTGVDVRLVL